VTDLVKAPPVMPIPDDSAHLDLLIRQAEHLAQAGIIATAYRRKPADIIAAGLAGRTFGWDVMTSMRNYHIIEGSASMRPEAMLGLVRQAGHSVQIENEPGIAVARGKRADTGDEHAASFTMGDAQAAGLADKRNWKQYQENMLTWRAVSKLCRYLFPDVVLGAGYVPEELGADVNAKGEIVPDDEPWDIPPALEIGDDGNIPVVVAKTRILYEVNGDKDAARQIWGDRGSDSLPIDVVETLIKAAQSLNSTNDGITLWDIEEANQGSSAK
tara:strand:- start:1039 stop:1851 length:813 start_codon:yes stop_codon:yes gene_type:complete